MDWIRRSIQIGQAVKGAQRLRHILAVFAKHGFVDILNRMNLGKYLPKRMTLSSESGEELDTPTRLRQAFEELGPTFVKLGQVLASRPDIVPEAFIDELIKLQDNVRPLDFETIKRVVERELGKEIGETFRSFNKEPLASASIAQVHEAVLISGESVVVKVQRPGIAKMIKTDLSMMEMLAKLAEKYIPELRITNPTAIVDEFFKTLNQELNFIIEANNIHRAQQNMAAFPEIVIPKVYKAYSTERVLTLEQFRGVRMTNMKAVREMNINLTSVVEAGVRANFKSILIDGVFHGDLHGGNLFILENGKLGIIDFGIVGRLTRKSRDQLANMVMSLITEDYENLCYQYIELSDAYTSIDMMAFQRDIQNAISPYYGLTLNEVNSGKILIESTKIAAKYKIRVPGEWMLVFKTIVTLEGLGRSLDPHFDMLSIAKELAKDLIKNQYSPERLSKDLLWIAKDVASLMQVLPRQLKWMFRKFNSDDFAFEIKIPEISDLKQQMNVNGKRAGLGLVIAGLFIAGSIALQYETDQMILGLPIVSFAIFCLALLLLGRLLLLR